MDVRDTTVVSAALAWWGAHLRCAEPGEGSPGDPDYRPPAGCEVPIQVRWERGDDRGRANRGAAVPAFGPLNTVPTSPLTVRRRKREWGCARDRDGPGRAEHSEAVHPSRALRAALHADTAAFA